MPDLPDKRDYPYSDLPRRVVRLPKAVMLKGGRPGALGSCTANALAGSPEFLERKDKVTFVYFSRFFIYYAGRVIEHSTKYDKGAMIRDGVRTLAKQGACIEKKCLTLCRS